MKIKRLLELIKGASENAEIFISEDHRDGAQLLTIVEPGQQLKDQKSQHLSREDKV